MTSLPNTKPILSPAIVLLVVLVLLAAYANHFQNAFHFDDSHTIENNLAIRDLANIPRFFRDATTFSSLPSNQSYRPLVSTLLAVSYALGGGLTPVWFHLPIFLLHVAVVLLLVVVLKSLLDAVHPAAPNAPIALLAAIGFGLHPANADTVNYIIASSDVLSTLGILASFALYLTVPGSRKFSLFVLPAAMAVLAKPPAAIFALLFAFYSLLFLKNPKPAGWREHLNQLLPAFAWCGAAVWLVQIMTPHTWVAGGVNTHDYLITQPYVAAVYFRTFFFPYDLSADYDLTPFASVATANFWIGAIFLTMILATTVALCRRPETRVIGFGLGWFVIGLLPTSLLPLAEVMNDHRTFLPYAGLVISLAGLVALVSQKWPGPVTRRRIFLATLVILTAAGVSTYQRNKIWRTEESLWRDVTIKSPRNGRGLMNYGNVLMARGDYAGARDYFLRALQFAPRYPTLFINLAVLDAATGRINEAEDRFVTALQLAPANPESYTFYGRFLMEKNRSAEAVTFLEKALALSPDDAMARDLLPKGRASATAHPPTPDSLLALSLQYDRMGRYTDSIAVCREALALRSNFPAAWNNIGSALNQLGRFSEAADALEEALRLKPDFVLARNNLQYARAQARAVAPKISAPSPSDK